MKDDEITSDELDGLLDRAETLNVARPASGTEVRLYVAVDSETLHELEQRAAATGIDLNAGIRPRDGLRAHIDQLSRRRSSSRTPQGSRALVSARGAVVRERRNRRRRA